MSTFIEKILGDKEGSVVTIKPNHVIVNDGVSHAVVDEVKKAGNYSKVWVFHDHDVPTGRPEAAAVLRQNLAFADENSYEYVQAKGIGYQYLLNEVVQSGEILVGGGSHASIFGAKKALGINVSIPELARIIETGRYSLIVPETIHLEVIGELKDHVEVMDAAMHFLAVEQDLKNKVIEVYCPTLTDAEKAVFLSMIGLTGAFTAVVTDEKPVESRTLNLSDVKPMLMLPCEKRNEQSGAEIVEKKEMEGTVLNAGQLSGYTGGTIEALRRAGKLMKDNKVAMGFRLTICPATSRDYLMAMEEGLITQFIDFGAQIQSPGDRSVVIQGAGAMGHDEKLITTGLYTFAGAMGCTDVEIYSSSVDAVVQAALTKRI